MAKIQILSLDFDRCVFSQVFLKGYREGFIPLKKLLDYNQPIKQSMEDAYCNGERVVLMVGSNCQSQRANLKNSAENNTPCAFLALSDMVKRFKQYKPLMSNPTPIKVEPLLLEDIAKEEKVGTNFRSAANRHQTWPKDLNVADAQFQKQFCKNIWQSNNNDINDESKLLLVYAQMHHMASCYPNDELIYNFYDDEDEILTPLHVFFSVYPFLIPKNVTLSLNHYVDGDFAKDENEKVKVARVVQGIGPINADYRGTVSAMWGIAALNASVGCIVPEKISKQSLAEGAQLENPVNGVSIFSKQKNLKLLLEVLPALEHWKAKLEIEAAKVKIRATKVKIEDTPLANAYSVLLDAFCEKLERTNNEKERARIVAIATEIATETKTLITAITAMNKSFIDTADFEKAREALETYRNKCLSLSGDEIVAAAVMVVLGAIIVMILSSAVGAIFGASNGIGWQSIQAVFNHFIDIMANFFNTGALNGLFVDMTTAEVGALTGAVITGAIGGALGGYGGYRLARWCSFFSEGGKRFDIENFADAVEQSIDRKESWENIKKVSAESQQQQKLV